MEDKLNSDGSMAGKTFSGPEYKGEHPTPKEGETYKEYYGRVCKCKAKGFHLGDLSWANWRIYCDAQGYNSVNPNDLIYGED